MPKSSTNIRNRVNKLYLPKTKPLMPLFEVVSNAIHAIDEAKGIEILNDSGRIDINILRYGNQL